MYYDDTYELVRKYFKVNDIEVVINVFIREKFLRLTMGFRYFMYSHSLVPVIDLWVRVVTKLVSEHEFSLLILKLLFCVFLHYCGIRLSNVGFVIIAFSIMRCVCFVIVFDFVVLSSLIEK